MSKAKPKIDSRQGGLFEYLKPEKPPAPGSLNASTRIHQAVAYKHPGTFYYVY